VRTCVQYARACIPKGKFQRCMRIACSDAATAAAAAAAAAAPRHHADHCNREKFTSNGWQERFYRFQLCGSITTSRDAELLDQQPMHVVARPGHPVRD
jgi:hypothetical protein